MEDEKKPEVNIDKHLSEMDEIRESDVVRLDEAEQTIHALYSLNNPVMEILTAQNRVMEAVRSIQASIPIDAILSVVHSYDLIIEKLKEIDPVKYNEEHIADLKGRAEKFAEMGWALVIDVNEDCFFDDSLLEMGKRDFDKYMMDFYIQNDYTNLYSLADFITERTNYTWKEQVNDALRLFVNGDFKVVIPFVMTLIEAEMIRYSGRDKYGGKLRKDFKSRIEKVDDKYIFLATILVDNILTDIFNNKKVADIQGELLNRNLVLHGKSNPDAWGEVEFIKILNVIGSLAMLDDLFEIEKSF